MPSWHRAAKIGVGQHSTLESRPGVAALSVKPEFSRPYNVDRLPEGGLDFALEASAAERAGLSRRFDLVALDRLEAAGRVQPVAGRGLIEVEGRLRAALSQRCVVTLEPVPAEVEAEFRRIFARDLDTAEEVEVDPEADEPEPLEDSSIDVGELVAEELAMALDPYPRAPEADATLAEIAPAEAEPTGAFASLAPLRRH
jgi:uncharacterized metal-binding protein YceD (DUF177 family)